MRPDDASPLHMGRLTLPNGIDLVRQEPPADAASFAVSVVTPAGWAYDPAGGEGRALLLSELATAGAGALDRMHLARELDRRGGSLASECHPEYAEVTLTGPSRELEALLPLLFEAVLAPRLEPKELALVKRQVIERQMREETQPDRRAEKELFHSLFPRGHPYHATGLGTARSLATSDRAQLRRFLEAHRAPADSFIVATARPSIEALARLLRRPLAKWPGGAAAEPSSLPRLPAPPRATAEFEVPGGSQVEVRLGGPALAHDDPNYPALVLANEVLGGRVLLSRLFQRLREQLGLVYHTSSHIEALRWGGYYVAQAGAERKKLPKVIEQLRAETRAMGEKPLPASELDRIRESLIGSIWLELETTQGAHALACELAYFRLPERYFVEWPSVLRAVTPEQVRAAAAESFDLTRSALVVAGPLGKPPASG